MAAPPWPAGRRSRALVGLGFAGVAALACRGDSKPSALARTLEARFALEVRYEAWSPRPTGSPRPAPEDPGPVLRSAVPRPGRGDGDPIATVAASLEVSADVETLRRAVAILDAASRLAPARRLTALAAAEQALGRASGEPAPLLDAYGHAAAAVAAGGGAPSLFDQALIAGDLGLCRVAGELWDRYLELDPGSAWAAEARDRRAELSCRQANAPGPDERFVGAMERLLPAWLAARRTDPRRAAELLAEIEAEGERLASESGDVSIRALAAELRALRNESHAAALVDYARGREAFDAVRNAEAGPLLRRALPGLEAARSELVPWCRLWLAGLEIYESRFEAAIRALDALLASAPADRPYLVGRLEWALGLARLREGSLVAAHDRMAAAEAVFGGAGYRAARASVATLRSDDTLARFGLDVESWRLRLAAIRTLETPHPLYYLHNGLVVGGRTASEEGRGELAQAFFREAELVAADSPDPSPTLQTFETLIWRARALCRVDPAAGLAAFHSTLDRLALDEGPLELRSTLEASAVIGAAACGRDPLLDDRHPDDEHLAAAIAYFRPHGPIELEIQGLRTQAARAASRGDRSRARAILGAAIDRIQEVRGRTRTEEAVADHDRDIDQSVYDAAIGLALDDGRSLDALALLESARGLTPDPSPRATLDRLLADHGSDAASSVILDFAVVGDRIAWWRIEGRTVRAGVRSARQTLEKAQNLIHDLQSDRTPSSSSIFADLYDALLSVPLAGVPSDRPLILVPDRVLQQIPFAALRNPTTGVRLIGERAISLRVSLEQAMVPAPTPTTRAARKDWRVVVVGDPSFDETALPLLPRLPGASDEADAVEGVYGADRAVTLFGRAATPHAVALAAENVEVIHLAAHVLPGDDPLGDVFVLAASGEGTGLAGPEAMLPATTSLRLAVLSACTTAGRHPSRTGGLLGLARGFSNHGVEATLGTLWPIADRSLKKLMIDFHGGIRSGLAASEALRRAQARLLHDEGEDGSLDGAALALFGDLPAEN